MRTPGHDMELAVGFCVSEGLLDGASLRTMRYCGLGSAVETDFNVVDLETDGRGPAPVPRLTTVTSACGVCGSDSIEALAERLAPVTPVELSLDVIAEVAA